jgi:hypothetical protein
MSICARCATCLRHAFTISPGGWSARSAKRLGSARQRRCSSLPRARASRRRKTKRKTEIRFRCYPNNGHAATASAGPFCANDGHLIKAREFPSRANCGHDQTVRLSRERSVGDTAILMLQVLALRRDPRRVLVAVLDGGPDTTSGPVSGEKPNPDQVL